MAVCLRLHGYMFLSMGYIQTIVTENFTDNEFIKVYKSQYFEKNHDGDNNVTIIVLSTPSARCMQLVN